MKFILNAFFAFAFFPMAFAQESDKVKIKTITIINGDTTITEKVIDKKEMEMKKEMHKEHEMKMKGEGHYHHKKVEKEEIIIKEKGGKETRKTMIMIHEDGDGDTEFKNIEIHKNDKGEIKILKDGKEIKQGDDGVMIINKEVHVDKGDGDKHKKTMVKVMITEEGENKGSKKGKTPEGGSKENLKVYPNPSKGEMNFEFDLEGKEKALVTVTDVNGKEIFREEIKDKGHFKRTVQLGENAKGVYILTITEGKKKSTAKLVFE
jgi:hypothetical protein